MTAGKYLLYSHSPTFCYATFRLTGADMANAFLVHLIGDEIPKEIRGVVELTAKEQGDDEFAAYYGLV